MYWGDLFSVLLSLGVCHFQASSAYWRGNKDRESLQRVYGISYPDSKRLKVISLLASLIVCMVYFSWLVCQLSCSTAGYIGLSLLLFYLKTARHGGLIQIFSFDREVILFSTHKKNKECCFLSSSNLGLI